VVTTRGHVQYVATEFGVVNLDAQPLRRRAELLISIAHPDVRPDLRAAALRRFVSLPGSPG
jgi:acyl-CoA hydrolase